jgi:6-hydroxytryprostatin B O-methyltransferase
MTDHTLTLESLAATVVEKVSTLSYHLGAEGIPKPTLTEAGHAAYTGESTSLRKARYDLARAAKSLLLLAQGPEDTVLSLVWSAIDAANIDILVRFRFFDAVPLDTGAGITAADLAAKVDLPLDITERTARFAIGNGLFVEPTPGIFAHSAASARLARSPELCAVARMAAGPLTCTVVRTADALELQQAGRRGVTKTLFDGQSRLGPEDPAFCLAFPGYSDPWDMAHRHKEFAEVGHAFMREQGSTSRMRIDHLLKARDWSALGDGARVVDVGGSLGHASIALAEAVPHATFIVQDANTVALDQGRELVAAQFPHLAHRISFEVHDFFTPMPAAAGGDIFLFQWILHDWNDADAVRILKALVPGLKPGARVLIAEAVRHAPPAGLANTLDEKLVLFQDMTMLSAHNSRERSVAEFTRLFEEADGRFRHVATGGGVDGAYRSLLEYEFSG